MPSPGPLELLIIVVIGLMVVAPIILVARLVLTRSQPRPDPALDVLRTRFANGEIDEVEYERLRSALQRG